MNQLTDTERAYLAGFIDGEGCIFISRWLTKTRPVPQFALNVVVAQNNEAYLRAWAAKTGAGRVYVRRTTRMNKHANERLLTGADSYKACFQWRVLDREAGALLAAIYDYMILKKDEAAIAQRFLATRAVHGGRYSQVPSSVIAERDKLRDALMAMHAGHDGSVMPDEDVPQEEESEPITYDILPLF